MRGGFGGASCSGFASDLTFSLLSKNRRVWHWAQNTSTAFPYRFFVYVLHSSASASDRILLPQRLPLRRQRQMCIRDSPASMRSLVTIGFPGIRTALQHSGGTDDGNISFPGFLSPGGTHTLHSSKGCMARLGGAWQQLFSYPKDTKKKPNTIRKNLIFSYPGNNKRELSRTLIRTDMSVQVQTS